MRHPFPLFAAAMLVAAGALAAELPTWQPKEEPWGSWREVLFVDSSGASHDLWCPWSECGVSIKTGQAKLYEMDRQGSVPYTYYDHFWSISGSVSAKATYSTELSKFVLNLANQKAAVPGMPGEYETRGQASVTPTGYIITVLPPKSELDDAPKPPAPPKEDKPGKPKLPQKAPPSRPPHAPITKHPPTHAPATKAAGALSDAEKGWLTGSDADAYDTAVGATPKPSKTDLGKIYDKYRGAIADNIRPESKTGYTGAVAAEATTPGSIDKFLADVKHYSDNEVALTGDEQDGLKSVKDPDPAFANASVGYTAAMKFVSENGKPKPEEHVRAHQIVLKYRALVPPKTDKPAAPFDPSQIQTAAQFAALSPEQKQQLCSPPAGAKAPALSKDVKAACDKFLSDVAKKPDSDGKPKPGTGNGSTTGDKTPAKPFDPAAVKTLPQFNLLEPDQKKALCAGVGGASGAGPMGDCGDILQNADAAVLKCNGLTGTDQAATLKARSDCMSKVNACKNGTGSGTPLPAAPSSMTQAVKEACIAFNAGGDGGGGGHDKPTIGAGADVPSPSEKKKATEPEDKNFQTNVGNGLAFGVGGLLLGSFFGGPLVMLAAALVVGYGAYRLSKSINAPPDDKKKGS